MPNIQDELRALDAIVVAKINGRDVTRAELSAAFKRVSSKSNWKDPIDVVITVASADELDVIREAVVFFAGCVPTFAPLAAPSNSVRVTAKGYYLSVGA